MSARHTDSHGHGVLTMVFLSWALGSVWAVWSCHHVLFQEALLALSYPPVT